MLILQYEVLELFGHAGMDLQLHLENLVNYNGANELLV
jgi:hypothetical protein